MMLTKLTTMLDWLLGAYCIHCHNSISSQASFCQACFHDLPWVRHACLHCGKSLPYDSTSCGKCLQHPQSFDCVISPLRYEAPISGYITAMKFFDKLHLCRILGELMLPKLTQYYHNHPLPTIILPVPLHHYRLRQRGYNQAIEIAKPIAHHFNLTIDRTSAIRSKYTQPQTEIPVNQRKINVQSAFQLTKPISAKHIAIIDDVITTGHTVEAFAAMLKKQGIDKIDVWCCARTQDK